jgi:hypothetical protein
MQSFPDFLGNHRDHWVQLLPVSLRHAVRKLTVGHLQVLQLLNLSVIEKEFLFLESRFSKLSLEYYGFICSDHHLQTLIHILNHVPSMMTGKSIYMHHKQNGRLRVNGDIIVTFNIEPHYFVSFY